MHANSVEHSTNHFFSVGKIGLNAVYLIYGCVYYVHMFREHSVFM